MHSLSVFNHMALERSFPNTRITMSGLSKGQLLAMRGHKREPDPRVLSSEINLNSQPAKDTPEEDQSWERPEANHATESA